MLVTEHVDFTYPPPEAHLPTAATLHDVSFRVAAGEALAVMGASGSGKSTLCHVLAGLAPRYTSGEVAGTVRVAGHDVIATLPPIGTVGVLFQDAATQLFNTTVEDEVAWGLEAMGVPSRRIGAQVDAALAQFGLLDVREHPPWAISGGQQKRLALAAIWAMQPRVLLLDEPLGGLDPEGRREVLAAMEVLREHGTTLLLTTLRPQTASLAARALLLEDGTTTPPAPTTAILGDEARLVRAGIRYPPTLWPDLRASTPSRPTDPAIVVRDLHFSYPNGQEVLHGLDLEIPRGQFVAVTGTNGAGKSTLVRHFNGLLRPNRGEIRVMGRPTARRAPGDLANDVSFLFQRPEQQLFAPTVREEVAYGVHHLHLERAQARVDAALARFGLTALAGTPPAMLSYGAQRAVTLASLAALDAPVLVLDEPTVGLDGRGWTQLLAWLAERRAAGVTLVVVTHEMALAARADRVVALDGGHIVADGAPDVVLSQKAPGIAP